MNSEESCQSTQNDARFLEKVVIDIRSFVSTLDNCTDKKKVLLFPPINNYRRFLIHQVVEKEFSEANLNSLSVGKLYARRTIVYHSSNNIVSSDRNTPSLVKTRELKSLAMSKVPISRTKKSRKPDIQIYVPRGRRMLQTAQDVSGHQNQSTEEVGTCNENYPVIDLTTSEHWGTKIKENDFVTSPFDNAGNEIIHPGGDCADTSSTNATKNSDVNLEEYDLKSSSTKNDDPETDVDNFVTLVKVDSKTENLALHSSDSKPNNLNEHCDTRDVVDSCDILNSQIVDLTSLHSEDDVIIKNNNIAQDTKTTSESNQEIELREQNAVSTLPPKSIQTEVNHRSDAVSPAEDDSANSGASSSIGVLSSKSKSNRCEMNNGFMKASECDWEELFDDSGDFVDESLIDELLKTVGKVRIQHAAQDYTPFQTTEERTSNGESIIEVYNFPADFKTDDLLTVFASYRADQGFQIVWVDDTHALAIFSSPILADEVLNQELPFVKTRPLKNAIPKSRTKARNFVAAPVTRPKTCVSLARRLVSGHLGMRINVTDKQREAEKKLLSDAREKKRQIAKQKNDVWENISSGER